MSEPETQQELRGNFVTSEYEQRIEPFTASFVDELIRPFVLQKNSENKDKKKKLLDVGCGTGAVSLMAAAADGFQVTATDVSKDMVDRLEERAAERHYTIECLVADGQNLPTQFYSQFDYAVAHFSVIFFPSPLEGLRQIHKSLKSGCGQVVVSAWGNAQETPAFQVVPDAFAQVAPDAQLSKGRLAGSKDVMEELLVQAGFDEIKIVGPVARTLHVASASAYFERFYRASSKVRDAIDGLDDERVAKQVRERILELAAQRGGQPDGSIQLEAMAYFGYGEKA
jgi:ubiquinone/menaquinone biosynthesis C-methylase UbiE